MLLVSLILRYDVSPYINGGYHRKGKVGRIAKINNTNLNIVHASMKYSVGQLVYSCIFLYSTAVVHLSNGYNNGWIHLSNRYVLLLSNRYFFCPIDTSVQWLLLSNGYFCPMVTSVQWFLLSNGYFCPIATACLMLVVVA